MAETFGEGPSNPQVSSTSDRPKFSSACDACKRRKLKCTSTQPCQRCVATGVACTYGSVASRNTTIAYTRHLEAKIAELQALLLEQTVIQPEEETRTQLGRSQTRDRMIESLVGPDDDYLYVSPDDHTNTFHGRFAGLGVLRTVRDLCDEIAGGTRHQYGRSLAMSFDCDIKVPLDNVVASLALLPSREVLQSTIAIALDDAMSCQECIDRDELQRQIEMLYTKDPENYDSADRRALALVYSLMALGRQCDSNAQPAAPDTSTLVVRGVSYYKASRAIVESMNCAHLDCIRTIIYLANYLMTASMASKAHTVACVGIAAALRMGLHVAPSHIQEQYSPYELTQRRRVFAVLNITQISLSSMLGMPILLKDPDPSQVIAVPEEQLIDQGESLIVKEPWSPISATILNCRLLQVLAEVTKRYESVSAADLFADNYRLDYEHITKWENELRQWNDGLPHISPGIVTRPILHTQLTLRLIHASVRQIIYRPFLQHIVRGGQDIDYDQRGFECGSTGLQAAMQIIWLVNTMELNSLLHNSPWYLIFHLTIATSSLMLFELGAKHETTIGDTKAAARRARQILSKLGQSSLSARKCSESLDALQAEVSRSRTSTMSPRTRFMRAIGAISDEDSPATTASS